MKRKTDTPEPLYAIIASAIDAYNRSKDNAQYETWYQRHESLLEWIEINTLPSGSGIDGGTKIDWDKCTINKIDWDKCTSNKLVFLTDFHHMNEDGFYDGWTSHTITIEPHLVYGIDITISGKDINDIKDYLYEVYQSVLTERYVRVWDDETEAASLEKA